MADQTSDLERSYPASPKRIEQAHEEGAIARSRELSTFAVLITGALCFWLMGGHFYTQVSNVFKSSLRFGHAQAFDTEWMLGNLYSQVLEILIALAPLFGVLILAAVLSQLLLGGWIFTLNPLSPNFTRIDPLKGFKRILSVNSIVELIKAIAKALLVGGVAAWVIYHYKHDVFSLALQPIETGIYHLSRLLVLSFLITVAAMVFIVAIDVPFQVWDYQRQLRMTRQELREEMKETEGDPQIKARIRSQQREIARKRMMAEVPKADVIVTNPTHYAVALVYKENMRAPKVVAKGRHLIALKIREIGEQHRVPMLEAPKLARALYRHTELGDEIPEALYTAVAEVLAYIFQLRVYQERGGKTPEVPENLPVPDYMDIKDEKNPN